VNSLIVTRAEDLPNSTLTLQANINIKNKLEIKNNLSTNSLITLSGDLVLERDISFLNSENPVTHFGAALKLAGFTNSTITVDNYGQTLDAVEISKFYNDAIISLNGGDLNFNHIIFIKGLLSSGDNTIYLEHPTKGHGQGFTRAVQDGNQSHIIGKLAKTLINNGLQETSSEPRVEFPVGDIDIYRPFAITFNPIAGVPTIPNVKFIGEHFNNSPEGSSGIPIPNGVEPGRNIVGFPSFYWNIYSDQIELSSSSVYDLEFSATSHENFNDVNDIRIINRKDNSGWELCAPYNAYDNAVSGGIPKINIHDTHSNIHKYTTTFTLGIAGNSNPPVTDQQLFVDGTPFVRDLDNPPIFPGNIGKLIYYAESSNPSIAAVSLSGSVLTVTPLSLGIATIQLTITDVNNDFLTYSFNVSVNPNISSSVSGKVFYDNLNHDPFIGATVKLIQDNLAV
jgi:hypothetical protein